MKLFGLEIRRAGNVDYAEMFMQLRLADALAGGPGKSATVEACIALWERGGALMRADNAPDYVDGVFFAQALRDLATYGQTTWYSDGAGLLRCERSDKIRGGFDVMLAARSLGEPAKHKRALDAEVVHVAINADRSRPWEGRSPAFLCSDTVTLDAALDAGATSLHAADYLGAEMLFAPARTPAEHKQALQESLFRSLKEGPGKILIGENSGGANNAVDEWKKIDLTPDSRKGLVHELVPITKARIEAAYGVPPLLLNPQAGAASLREAMRAFNFQTLAPLARMLQAEIRAKIAPDAVVDTNDYLAVDAAGRARAIKSYTDTGIPLNVAAAMVGFHELPEPARRNNAGD